MRFRVFFSAMFFAEHNRAFDVKRRTWRLYCGVMRKIFSGICVSLRSLSSGILRGMALAEVRERRVLIWAGRVMG